MVGFTEKMTVYADLKSGAQYSRAFQVALPVKNPPAHAGDLRDEGQSLGGEDPLEEGMATNSSILAWRVPRTEEPGELHTVHEVSKIQTRRKRLSMHTCTVSHWLPRGRTWGNRSSYSRGPKVGPYDWKGLISGPQFPLLEVSSLWSWPAQTCRAPPPIFLSTAPLSTPSFPKQRLWRFLWLSEF